MAPVSGVRVRPGSPTAQPGNGVPQEGGAAEHIPHPELPESFSEAGLQLSHAEREAQAGGLSQGPARATAMAGLEPRPGTSIRGPARTKVSRLSWP